MLQQFMSDQPSGKGISPSSATGWRGLREEFLMRVHASQREAAAFLLRHPDHGGRGLRLWLHRLLAETRPLPELLPIDLVQVYLDYSEAEPQFDCADCGVAIPVKPGWNGSEVQPQAVYFAECPSCGGAVGLHAYWSRDATGSQHVDGVRDCRRLAR